MVNPGRTYLSSSVSIANGVGYVGTYGGGNRVYAFDPDTGDILWSATANGGFNSWPVIADGKLYVYARYGRLYAYALNGGDNAAYKPRQPPSYASLHPDHRLKPVK